MAQQITINLLPVELKTNQKAVARRRLLIKISVLILVVSIGAAAAVLIAGLTFKVNVESKVKLNEELRNQIAKLSKAEGLVTDFKSRLDLIGGISQKDSPQIQAFTLITILIPDGVELENFAVDKSGLVKISIKTDGINSLSTLFENITIPKNNEAKIASAKVNSLTLGINQTITADLDLKLNTVSQSNSNLKN